MAVARALSATGVAHASLGSVLEPLVQPSSLRFQIFHVQGAVSRANFVPKQQILPRNRWMSLLSAVDSAMEYIVAPSSDVWRTAEAVCFDVDSTVCIDEGIDELASYCGAGEAVASWTAKLTPGIRGLVEKLHSRGTKVYLVSGGKVTREPGPLPVINTKITACLDPDGWKTVSLIDARCAFDTMISRKNVFLWTIIISTYVRSGHGDDAFDFFCWMNQEGDHADAATLTTLLGACSSLDQGRTIHTLRNGLHVCLQHARENSCAQYVSCS